jgi:hypothetical protein
LHVLTNSLAELTDLIGGRGEQLAERLAQAHTWAARFDLLDELLPRWLAPGPAQVPAVARVATASSVIRAGQRRGTGR